MNPGYVSAIANHLWQSTLFAGLAALLTLGLRNNHARVRHGVWLAASCKFLIPLSVLFALGGQIRWRAVPETTQSNIAIVMDQVSQPFPTPAISARPVAPPDSASLLPEILLTGWALGFLGLSGAWWIRWRRIRDAVRAGSPLRLEIPIRAISSPTLLEPGVFGVLRPVLLLPESMFDRLTPPQVEAIFAHELCHVRHKDNLAASLHMFVETVFWFHPLVWWVGKRIVEERERACDEEVLRLGSEPRVYAEGILNICKLYLEAPLVCVSGITGADLKRRIHQILSAGAVCQLSWRRKFLLAAAGLAALAWPLAVGIMNAPAGHAQSADSPPLKFEVASVKPNKSGSQRSPSMILPGGRFTATNNTVRALILNAYQIPPYLLSGGPSWIDSEGYDVEAKPADGAIDTFIEAAHQLSRSEA
jgi:bla regulator protein BlaR1